MSTIEDFTKAIGFATYSVTDSAAIGIVTTYNDVPGVKATLTVTDADVRYRYDGTDPTPSVGHYLSAGFQRDLFGHTNLDQLRIICVSGTAKITVTIEAEE